MTTKASKTTKPATPRKAKAWNDRSLYVPPKKLSKAALWRRENPEGILKIIDMRAVMK